VLGPLTIGTGARVGSNAVVLKDVPPGATVVGIPARPIGPQPVVKETCFPAYGTAPGAAIDPVARVIDRMSERLEELSARVAELEHQHGGREDGHDEERRIAAS
jgi:serine O-acetyltransferase